MYILYIHYILYILYNTYCAYCTYCTYCTYLLYSSTYIRTYKPYITYPPCTYSRPRFVVASSGVNHLSCNKGTYIYIRYTYREIQQNHIYIYVYICTYVYTERERERETARSMICRSWYIYTHSWYQVVADAEQCHRDRTMEKHDRQHQGFQIGVWIVSKNKRQRKSSSMHGTISTCYDNY